MTSPPVSDITNLELMQKAIADKYKGSGKALAKSGVRKKMSPLEKSGETTGVTSNASSIVDLVKGKDLPLSFTPKMDQSDLIRV